MCERGQACCRLPAGQSTTEEARFELAVDGAAHDGLAIRCLKPLGHSSSMEHRGFEPLKPIGRLIYSQVQLTALPMLHSAHLQHCPLSAKMSNLPGWSRTSLLYLPGVAPFRLAPGSSAGQRRSFQPHSGGRTRTFNLHVQSVAAYHWPAPEHYRTIHAYSVRESNSRFVFERDIACH